MNIFYLSSDPVAAAQAQGDKHVVKMILESAQMLSTAHRVLDGDKTSDNKGAYKATHKNHPSNVWTRENSANYKWLREHALALCAEYKRRYGRVHKTQAVIHSLFMPPSNIPQKSECSNIPQCMPDEYKNVDPIKAYRAYYMSKRDEGVVTYKDTRTVPYWMEYSV